MTILWEEEDGLTPRQVHTHLGPNHKVAYTTVTTVITRLWNKGQLTRTAEGISFRYSTKESQEEYAARRMQEILDTAGDRNLALNRFMGHLTEEDLRLLREDTE